MQLLARERRRLGGLDPSAVWAVAADPNRVEAWLPLQGIAGAGQLMSSGDRFRADLELAPWRGPVEVRIADYVAGRSFRFECTTTGGVKLWLTCRVETLVETAAPASEVTLEIDGEPLPRWSPARVTIGRALRRSVGRLAAEVRRR